MVRNMSELLIPAANNRSKSAAAAGEDRDPYRWLEDSASPRTAAWVAAQNELTQAYLASAPAREVIRSRLTERWDFARSGVPFERGGRWFAVRNPPLHNVRPGRYPATLLTTGDHDDRVVPSHSFKFAAALQEAQRADAPVLLRVEASAGHGHGKPAAKAIAEAADRLAFIECALGAPGPR
jgi:prolyl oligopeptidase PreP (S9A serine peptidase family)